MRALIFFISLFASLSACSDSGRVLTSGTYTTAATAERITIDGAKIHFKVFADENGTRLIDRSCEYSVWPDGTIQPQPLASQEVVTGIGKFEWRLAGETIVQSNPRAPASPAKVFTLQKQE